MNKILEQTMQTYALNVINMCLANTNAIPR